MIRRLFEKCLLRPEDLRPSRDDWEIIGVFNPGAAVIGEEMVLLVRVAEQPCERRAGYTGLPRWDSQLGSIVEWVKEETVEVIDPYDGFPVDGFIVTKTSHTTAPGVPVPCMSAS